MELADISCISEPRSNSVGTWNGHCRICRYPNVKATKEDRRQRGMYKIAFNPHVFEPAYVPSCWICPLSFLPMTKLLLLAALVLSGCSKAHDVAYLYNSITKEQNIITVFVAKGESINLQKYKIRYSSFVETINVKTIYCEETSAYKNYYDRKCDFTIERENMYNFPRGAAITYN